MKQYAIALFLIAVALFSGCSVPDRVRGHILQPTDLAVPAYQDNLVILDVRVETEGAALKLYDVGLRDTATGLPWRLPLFSNVIMKTKALPFEEKDGAIYHTMVLDLPTGTYELETLEFKDYVVNLAGTNVSQTYEHEPPEPLYFEVVDSSQPQYLGMLEIAINPYLVSRQRDGTSQVLAAAHESRTQDRMAKTAVVDRVNPVGTDAMLGAAATATATEVQTLSGSLEVTVIAPDEESARAAGNRFRALSGRAVTPARMWLQPDDG